MRRILFAAAVLACGCNSPLFNQHAQELEVGRAMMTTVMERMGKDAASQFAASGQVIDPGIDASFSIEYHAKARFIGLAGQMSASAAGKMDRQLTDRDAADISAVLNDTRLSAEARNVIVGSVINRMIERHVASSQSVTP